MKFYITTPIYYPSGKAHIGHTYTTVAADTAARFHRLKGDNTMFLTGTDEHGLKIEQKAKEQNVTPKEYVDNITETYKDLWCLLNISYDRFIRTTDDYHVKAVQKIFETLHENGYIYKGSYEGNYCVPCESFWTDSQLKDKCCPDCGRPVEKGKEEAYFFKLSMFKDRLIEHFLQNPEFLRPKSSYNEMLSFLKEDLQDLCVSRTSFSWGIPVTFDKKHVVYVWLDALTNYITAMGYNNDNFSDFTTFWPADVHFVGKEIVRFHTIIWPAILMALDLPLPKRVFSHGWLLFGDGSKMSKSKGNVVDPVVLCDRYGVDAIRYYLLREIPFGADGNFTNEALISRINSDLCNDLGNLVNRTIAMVHKYFGGVISENAFLHEKSADDKSLDDALIESLNSLYDSVDNYILEFHFNLALESIFANISKLNKYIDDTAPWILAKDESKKNRLEQVLYNLLEGIRICTIMLSSFIPETSAKIFSMLKIDENMQSFSSAKSMGQNKFTSTLGEAVPLYPRIDVEKELKELSKIIGDTSTKSDDNKACDNEEKLENVMPFKEICTYDDFSKLDLRVAKILECEKMKKSKKLLKITVDDGIANRVILSGIAQFYEPADLIGKSVVIIANLAPREMCGETSNGMILAAGDNAKLLFVEAPAGTTVS